MDEIKVGRLFFGDLWDREMRLAEIQSNLL